MSLNLALLNMLLAEISELVEDDERRMALLKLAKVQRMVQQAQREETD